jgi:hypothetical protein
MAVLVFTAGQNAMKDPDITIPPGVNDVEEFYQHTNATQGAELFEQFMSGWGEFPINGVNQNYDVTA